MDELVKLDTDEQAIGYIVDGLSGHNAAVLTKLYWKLRHDGEDIVVSTLSTLGLYVAHQEGIRASETAERNPSKWVQFVCKCPTPIRQILSLCDFCVWRLGVMWRGIGFDLQERKVEK